MNLFGFEFNPSLPTDPKRAGTALVVSSIFAGTPLAPLAPLAGMFAADLIFGPQEEQQKAMPMQQQQVTINKTVDKSRTILGGAGKPRQPKPKNAATPYTQPLLSISPRQ